MQFKPDEFAAIMKDFDEPGSLAPTGLHLGGTKYMVIQGEPGTVIRGKKVLYFALTVCIDFIIHTCDLTFLMRFHMSAIVIIIGPQSSLTQGISLP